MRNHSIFDNLFAIIPQLIFHITENVVTIFWPFFLYNNQAREESHEFNSTLIN